MIRMLVSSLLVTACLAGPISADSSDLVYVDVVDGWAEADGRRMAGIRIRVADGWKTYWRSPGEAGVPPRFDWSGSQNLAHAEILWPRPQIFDTYGQRTLGYDGEVILPVALTPIDPSQPITVTGQAELGVCRDVCVAVDEGYAETEVDGQVEIRASLNAQPDQVAPESAHCVVEPISDGLRLTATLSVPHQGGSEWTVFELLRRDVWVSEPILDRQGGSITATADLVPPEAAPFDLDPSGLRITVLGADGAMETLGCSVG